MAGAEQATVNVRIAQGELLGRRRRTVWGFPYCCFQGIPYAAPPVGPLRFKPPQPAAGWSGVRDATKPGNIAPQIDMTGKYVGDEDCLFINVCTPKLPSEGSSGLLPVMVHIHGGGLMLGSGNEDFGGPDFLIRYGVVFVSLNYRLGVLGFLNAGDRLVPGNMGFKDQVMALRWVKDNIASFGGDPDNVTIFGGSAGGWSCHGLVLSPLAKGLFHRAIAHSGVVLGDGACSDRVRARSFTLAAHLGLKTDDPQQLVDFLRQQPARLLVENALFGRSEDDKARGLLFPFAGTVVEPADADGGAFFPREPAQLLRSGDFQAVPFITGVGTHEGSAFATDQSEWSIKLSGYAENHHLLIPTNLRCPDSDKDALAEQIRRFYFGDRDIGPDTKFELCTLLGDLLFTYHAVRAAKLHTLKSKAPAYFFVCHYISDRVPQGPLGELIRNLQKMFDGAVHGGGYAYIVCTESFGVVPEPGSFEAKLTDQLSRLWTNFAKTGQLADPEVEVSWPAFTEKDESYLHITSDGLCIAKRPFEERVAFWEKLYDRYES
ncbi:esterase FE4-like isoform X2 [Schistocerca gregaria]|uniref:esterase FE4-like isoform X2 n=1 Tax=Schistocerca gregaria TaxID=7010 RepID=UPI00211DFAD1|nr:esterase FE4-like isoform X2 [Schistocerca gregaria]